MFAPSSGVLAEEAHAHARLVRGGRPDPAVTGQPPGVVRGPGARVVRSTSGGAGSPRRSGVVVGVVGARGGAGASTFAAALAHRLARRGSVALVDLERAGGGVDVLVGLEGADGLRWPDLAGARGEVAGAELVALLPSWSGCTVLSADRARPGPPPAAAVGDVLGALAGEVDHLVLDLDRADVAERSEVLATCRLVLLVVPRDLRAVAGALALRPALVESVEDVRLVVRGPAPGGLSALELAHVVDLPIGVSMPADRAVAAACERGGGPAGPALRRGPLRRAVARLAAEL
ncbi:septum site-determining protein Ssd [Cellulomonas cellasea]|uniref:Secretion/DNA translocation related CpaE-like protein n=1 Tax=Cellulomonas cellasea TaxID=43670 RepID=A0A7W4YAS9_9CELL|nr:septum site-determining protein Ssd [Cellulomonas cellasea]MBB2922374.1 secretion/DNA translocation related CpaE-like protein [Cellulomonas cellasea]